MTQSTPARRAMQRFLREVAKSDGGLAIYGSDAVDAALDANRVNTVLLIGNNAGHGIGVRAYYFPPNDECARILSKAFGGCAAILKRGA